jgi:hypothetical protein
MPCPTYHIIEFNEVLEAQGTRKPSIEWQTIRGNDIEEEE